MDAELYLDHNAGSPLRSAALAAMLPWLERGAANPSSLHRGGQAARAALERARVRVAARLGGRPEDWVFTSGATEACNLALQGAWMGGRPLLVGSTEHPAVLETALAIRADGGSVEILPVKSDGSVDILALEEALGRFPRALVALMAANNETGVLHPWDKVEALAHQFQAALFCDLAQAAGKIAFDVHAMGLDLAALSAAKFGGPQGCGLLYVRSGFPLKPLLHGGHQERGVKPGTENVAGAVGLAAALDDALESLPHQARDWAAGVAALQAGLAGRFSG
ncbi:MAG: cysteine desulfurase family protein, partial [bacterium]